MDITTVAKNLLELLADENVSLSDDLTVIEPIVRDAVMRIGAKAVELRLEQQTLGYEGSSRACDNPDCGHDQKFVAHRPRTLGTLMGQVEDSKGSGVCDRRDPLHQRLPTPLNFPNGNFSSLVATQFDQIVRNDSYKTYIMYLPPGSGSHWVPLKMVSWSWAADAGVVRKNANGKFIFGFNSRTDPSPVISDRTTPPDDWNDSYNTELFQD